VMRLALVGVILLVLLGGGLAWWLRGSSSSSNSRTGNPASKQNDNRPANTRRGASR
jgi:hypothetical protein